MARDIPVKEFRVQPVENNGSLTALTIQPTVRTKRVSDDGKLLSHGWTRNDGDPIEIPIGKVADLIRELADWPVYFASGEYERDNQSN